MMTTALYGVILAFINVTISTFMKLKKGSPITGHESPEGE